MRAGTSTDDFLVLGDEVWTIVDSSPGVTPLCGICTGHTMYGYRREDRISYESCFEIADGMLTMKGARFQDVPWLSEWKSKYDKFIGVETVGDDVPYTGWLLLYGMRSRWAKSLEEGIFASRLAEARFDGGLLVDFVEHTTELEALRASLPDDYSISNIWDDGERVRACGLMAHMLIGEYNCTMPGYPPVAKRRGWGLQTSEDSYECANCNKLREHRVLPLKAPKHPRKRKYREIGLVVPRFMPGWVRELADELDMRGEPWDGKPREPGSGMSEEEFGAFAAGSDWRFAKTMPECPHWYMLRKDADDRLFVRAIRYIRHHGFDCKWNGEAERTYLDFGEHYYWTMGSSDRETTLINRCSKDDYIIDIDSMYFRGRK